MRSILSAAAAILIATTAAGSAADLGPRYAKAPPIIDTWSWTGFYVGAHVGGGWGTTESTLTGAAAPGLGAVAFTFPFSQNTRSGFLGGGQVGYNWQNGWVVFGVQGDIAGMNVNGTTPCVVVLSCTTESDWLATVSGRIGGVVADRTLLYVKGGGAWMNSTHSVSAPGGGIIGGPGGAGLTQLTSADSTSWGWLLGMGVEYMFAKNWTGFLEYNYIDFDTKNEAFALGAPAAFTINADLKNKLSIAKVGVNYKF
ncbi:MAG: outer membrane beta-barrel protein [Bradyrhizobium sp.]|nr:outer membrane beta-barrel protein [Bradyrhizobium sp.]